MRILSNGIGVGVGDVLLTNEPLYIGGNVWFVNNGHANAADAAAPRGLNPEYPLETLSQAITNSAGGDIVVLGSTHDEITGNPVDLTSKYVIIVGEGRTEGVPSARLRNEGTSGDPILSCGTVPVQLRNIRFGPGYAAGTYASVNFASGANGAQVIGCQFEVGDYDTNEHAVKISSSGLTFEDCVFKSVGTDPTAAPVGLVVTVAPDELVLRRCTLDAGVTGFSGSSGYGYAADLSAAPISGLTMENMSLLNGADVKLSAGSTITVVHVATCTGSSKVVW